MSAGSGGLLLEPDGSPMIFISQATAEFKASVIGQQRGVTSKVLARYYRGEMLGYVIRVWVKPYTEG